MITVGGKITTLESKQYEIGLVDKAGKHVQIDVIGIDRISSPIVPTNLAVAAQILDVRPESISRPTSGEIDILIGIQYAAYHPERIKSVGHLTLYENRFGRAIAGTHLDIKDATEIDKSCAVVKVAQVLHTNTISRSFSRMEALNPGFLVQSVPSCQPNPPSSFLEREELGTSSSPKCGSCKCGKCHLGGKQMSIKEEKEYNVIEANLEFNEERSRWMTPLP